MQSIDNSAALNYNQPRNVLAAAVTFAYVAATKILTITDATTYPSGDSRKAVNIEVFDKFGGKKQKQIAADDVDNAVAIDLDADDADGKPLDVTEGVAVNVTVLSTLGKVKDGSVHDVATLKASGNVNMQK